MRSRSLPIFGATAIALAVATTFAPAVSANSPDIGAFSKSSPASLVHTERAGVVGTCKKQLANDSTIGVVSQNFEAANDSYDNQGADDFRLKRRCTVTAVMVNGQYFNGSGPATSLHVTFYQNNHGTPGAVKSDQDNLSYTDASTTGNFTIPLSSSVTFLARKRFWVSVQVNMDFSAGGEWGWNTNSIAKGLNAQWRNPADGLGTGCTAYTDLPTCVPSGGGADFAFALLN